MTDDADAGRPCRRVSPPVAGLFAVVTGAALLTAACGSGPGSGKTYIGNLDPNGPVFQNADKVCSKEAGMLSSSQPEPPGSIMVGPAAPPAANRVRSSGSGSGPAPSGAAPVGNGGSGANG